MIVSNQEAYLENVSTASVYVYVVRGGGGGGGGGGLLDYF